MEVELDAKMRLKARIQVGRNPEFRKFLLDHPEIAKDVYSDQKVPDAPFGYTNEAPKKDAREMYIDSQPDFAPFGTIVKPDIEKVTNPLSDCWYERFVGEIPIEFDYNNDFEKNSLFTTNPATGLPMIGCVDAEGNTYGFS